MSQLRRVLSICFHVWVDFSFFLIEFVTHSNANGPPSLAQYLRATLTDRADTDTIRIFAPPGKGWTEDTIRKHTCSTVSAAIDQVRESVGQCREGPHQRTIMERVREDSAHRHWYIWMSVPVPDPGPDGAVS